MSTVTSFWRVSDSAPIDAIGFDGHYWVNTTTGLIYRRASGVYVQATEMSAGAEVRHAWDAPYSYCGKATSGSGDGDAVWTITRIQVAADGTTTIATATNVTWTDYATHIYS